MQLLVIEHDHVSRLEHVAERFEERGFDVTSHLVVDDASFANPGVMTAFPDFDRFDAVVLMGAPWSTYDHELIGSWVVPELDQVAQADAAGVPVLGICFGGQLLASVLGGTVERSHQLEIGWTDVETDEPSIVPPGPWFQWHYDRWVLPPDAVEIARNPAASQAFVLRRNLAVQFHPELSPAVLDGWLGNGGDAKAREVGLDPDVLVAETAERAGDARLRARRLVDGFIDHVASRPLAGTDGSRLSAGC